MPKLRFFLATLLAVSGSAMAADYDAPQLIFSSPDRTVNFVGGIGYSWIRADEKVYFEGDRLSHLIWTSQTPVFTAAMSINPLADLTIDAKTRIGFLSTSRMEDYDWFGPFFKSFAFDDWTHHSSSEDTNLERYISGDVTLGYNLDLRSVGTLNLNSGFKYLNLKFDSSGGALTYSVEGFRDVAEPSDSRLRSISYEQRIPGIFVGAKWTNEFERSLVSARARVGKTLGAKDKDVHWKRSTIFAGDLYSAPFVELGADLHYKTSDKVSVFASLDYEKYFEMKGDAYITTMQTNETELDPGGESAAFRGLTITLGLRGTF
ncbi:outer membrane protease [Nitratireductor aestuarii]|uniref:Outer membrane protease n=1 Tax=Nitratireductor aestuarii TaxID=1735103 RepID=A0A916RU92_9HYPH|nr:omptin family outer membrane protease [Nitratireductor aestuarii]GGA70648.1 outer membrane protease [Nitratireductor aestuarii]